MTKRPLPPCLKCEERHEHCHSECEKYIAYQEANIEFSRAVKEQKTIDQAAKVRPWMRKVMK